MAGTLFVVATPIGNLEDLTFRALRTLKEVDLIAAEDTRRTAKLLAHYHVQKPVISLREHNEVRETPRLVGRLSAGESIALVSDAGTPGIADPGTRLVRAVRDAGLRVVPIPGANAVATALSASGFPASPFVFLGFPPASRSARTNWFKELADEPRTVVFFESPHRIIETINLLSEIIVKRPILICRELTKIHEELVERQHISSDGEHRLLQSKGEFTLVVAPRAGEGPSVATDDRRVVEIFGHLTNTRRPTRNEAIDIIATSLGSDPNAIKKIVKKHVMSGE